VNIIIPTAGSGRRFREDGYTLPKPLIGVLGEPMIVRVIKNLKISDDDIIDDKWYHVCASSHDQKAGEGQFKIAYTRGFLDAALDESEDPYLPWINKEYREWERALEDSTVHNFKDNPIVQRMLGIIDPKLFEFHVTSTQIIEDIDNIGREIPTALSGAGMRMLYYAKKVMERGYSSIVEIGGGVGEFYAILRAIGYQGQYAILDRPGVHEFQLKYLEEVNKKTGLNVSFVDLPKYEACVVFYSIGEFDNETKRYYIENVIKRCSHGFIVWNPHSGADQEIAFPCEITDEYPSTYPGSLVKQLTW